MTPDPQPPKKPFPYLVLLIPAAAFVLVLTAFLAIWQFLAPAERHVPVAYSEFLVEVQAGKVDEIHIRDREIRYRVRAGGDGGAVYKETVGPVPDQAFIASLKPTDPSTPPPKISFEK